QNTNHGNPSDTTGDTTDRVNLFGAASVRIGPAPVNLEALPAPAQLTPTAATSGGTLAGTYYYEVTALTQTGETTASNEQSVTVSGSTGEVTVHWIPVAGATGYKIYRGTSAGGENTLAGSVGAGAASFTDTGGGVTGNPPGVDTAPTAPHSTIATAYDTGLDSGSDPLLNPITSTPGGAVNPFSPNTTYYYVVVGANADGTTIRSEEQSYTTSGSGAQTVQLTWANTAPSDSITSYSIYRGTILGGENTLVGTVAGNVYSFADVNNTATQTANSFPPPTNSVFNGAGVIGNAAGTGTSTQVDLMKVDLHAGDALTVQLNTTSILSPLKPVVRIFDANGVDVTSEFQDSGQLPFGSLNSGPLGLRQFNTSDVFTAGNNLYLSPPPGQPGNSSDLYYTFVPVLAPPTLTSIAPAAGTSGSLSSGTTYF
ncbi:MAG: hypothetical protein ACREHD_16730, partial [Pirellulales bacterium]